MLVEMLGPGFEFNGSVIHRLTEGLSHADSLIQPPMGGNSLNWVLGHIVVNRSSVLDALGLEPLPEPAPAALARYQSGTDPVTEAAPGVLVLADLLRAVDASSARIKAGFEQMTPEALRREQDGRPVGQRLLGLYWHETYHIGQLELLRRVAGQHHPVF